MKTNYSDQLLKVVFDKSVDGNLVDLWLATHYDKSGLDIEETVSFAQRREVFLWVLERLLREGRIKLHKDGKYLEGTIEEQVNAFRQAWPKDELDAHRKVFDTDELQCKPSTAMGLWFFMDVCPAGVAWRNAEGEYVAAD